MDTKFLKGFRKIAAGETGSFMGRFANSALNAFGGPQTKPLNVPKPPPPPANVSPGGGQTMNQRMGNPFG